eukprot:tig00020563_g11331.t1
MDVVAGDAGLLHDAPVALPASDAGGNLHPRLLPAPASNETPASSTTPPSPSPPTTPAATFFRASSPPRRSVGARPSADATRAKAILAKLRPRPVPTAAHAYLSAGSPLPAPCALRGSAEVARVADPLAGSSDPGLGWSRRRRNGPAAVGPLLRDPADVAAAASAVRYPLQADAPAGCPDSLYPSHVARPHLFVGASPLLLAHRESFWALFLPSSLPDDCAAGVVRAAIAQRLLWELPGRPVYLLRGRTMEGARCASDSPEGLAAAAAAAVAAWRPSSSSSPLDLLPDLVAALAAAGVVSAEDVALASAWARDLAALGAAPRPPPPPPAPTPTPPWPDSALDSPAPPRPAPARSNPLAAPPHRPGAPPHAPPGAPAAEGATEAPRPYVSFVTVTRNDDYGGNLRQRFQIFVKMLGGLCERHRIDAELVVVDWNPLERACARPLPTS